MIEHISYNDGINMLVECKRILRPGGRIRLATPDLGRLLRAYFHQDPEAQQYVESSSKAYGLAPGPGVECRLLNNFMRAWGHCFVYDRTALRDVLTAAGFRDLMEYEPGNSEDKNLANLECHHLNIGKDNNQFETMVIEGRKPPDKQDTESR
jgi:predicted SAM-dependent methyltransferase